MNNRLKKELEEKQFISVLNNTKWKKFIKRIQNLEHLPECSVKYLLDPKSPYGFSYISWEEFKMDLKYVEWIIIKTEEKSVTLNLEFLQKIMKEEHIPFSIEGNNLKVWGYYQPNNPPNFLK